MLNQDNIILMTDSYKISHWKQYPPKTEKVYSYFESRGGEYPKVLFFGLVYILKKYLSGVVVDHNKIEEASEFCKQHFGSDKIFNREGWVHIIEEHQGLLPIRIKSVLEGSVVSTGNILFSVENICHKCFWLTSYLETILEQVWYPCTVATKSFYQKRVIKKYLELSGDEAPDFKLHDFGYRGSTSQESAAIGAAAHLVNFKGTDTIAGISLLKKYYNVSDMPAFSVPAAEHGTITSWGLEKEKDAYENILNQFPDGLVAVVSDSYNIYNAVQNIWGDALKSKVEKRKGALIIRPDSGNPVEVLTKVFDLLDKQFDSTVNEKGYRVLPPYVRVIQGDGIDEKSLPKILKALTDNKWSIDNIAFGSGGGLLQNVTRDTLKFAYKCSNITVDGQDRDVYKDPITDPGKASKSGRLYLLHRGSNTWETIKGESATDSLYTIFEWGKCQSKFLPFSEIRIRAEGFL